jgi:hypothetical protein
MSTARETLGAASLSISSIFPTIWKSTKLKPVMFPPGCAKLETKPCSTGSLTPAITMGMKLVACRSARMTGVGLPTTKSGANALLMHHGDDIACGQRNDVVALCGQERIIGHQNGGPSPLDNGLKRRADFMFGAGALDLDLQHERARCFLQLLALKIDIRIRRVHQRTH